MIEYEVGYWGLGCILQRHGSVFPKSICWALPCAILSAVMHHLLGRNDDVREYVGISDGATAAFGGFTFILGFLVVFRSQQAYSRWWEGGTLLQQLRGEWFNSFSSLLAFCSSKPEMVQDVTHFKHRLVRLTSLLYMVALEQVTTC